MDGAMDADRQRDDWGSHESVPLAAAALVICSQSHKYRSK